MTIRTVTLATCDNCEKQIELDKIDSRSPWTVIRISGNLLGEDQVGQHIDNDFTLCSPRCLKSFCISQMDDKFLELYENWQPGILEEIARKDRELLESYRANREAAKCAATGLSE